MARPKFSVKSSFENRVIPIKVDEFQDDNESVIISLRLHRKRKKALRTLFKAKGMDLSTGIRSVLYEWLNDQYKR